MVKFEVEPEPWTR